MMKKYGIQITGKTATKVALTTAVVLLPLSIYANEKYDNKAHDMDSKKEKGFFDKFGDKDHDDEMNSKYFKEKGINYVFEGNVEKKPKGKLNGEWTISGIKVIVNDGTFISHSEKKLKIGEEVEILAKRENGIITAIEMEED